MPLKAGLAFQVPWVPFILSLEEAEQLSRSPPGKIWCVVRVGAMVSASDHVYVTTTVESDMISMRDLGQKILDYMSIDMLETMNRKTIPISVNVDDLLNHRLGYLKKATWFEVTLPPTQLEALPRSHSTMTKAFHEESDFDPNHRRYRCRRWTGRRCRRSAARAASATTPRTGLTPRTSCARSEKTRAA